VKTACRFFAIVAAIAFCALGLNAQTTSTFVTADTNTQGNWMGTYGADGYDVANGPQSPTNGTLNYGSYAVKGESEWTYAGTTTDQRALETDMLGDRTAAAWYNAGTFSFDVNFTASNTHQVALYLLDWDHQGRAETITVTNYSSGAVLDTRSIPNTNSSSPAYTNTTSTNFGNGTYLIWNISGHVTITIAATSFPNGVVSGIFFGGSPSPTAPAITSVNNATFTVGTPGTFTVTTTGSPTPSLYESGTLPTGVSFVDNGNGTGILSGNPSTNGGSPYQITFTASNGVSPAFTQNFTLTVNPQVVTTGPSATFASADTNTEGNWMGTYGADGYDIANVPQSPANRTLSYGSYAVQGESEWTYVGSTTDQRALETDMEGDRTAATWYSAGTFSFDVNFTGTSTHQVALYLLDWDHQGRAETITVTNYSSGAVLDTRSIPNTNSSSLTYTNTTSTNFGNGTYLIWNISGHVTISIATNSGPNAVVAGIFFGGAPIQTPTAPAITSVNNAAFTVGTPGTFTVTTTGSPTPALNDNGASLPAGVSFVDNGNGTGTLSGMPAAGSNPTYSISFTAHNDVSPDFTQSFTLTVNPQVVTTGPSATFATADTNTEGNWTGTYGADGYDVANGPQSPANGTLTYGNYAVHGESEWTYAGTTTDQRALETDMQGGRTAATWYSTGTFSFDVNFTDTNTHQVALYVLDWDRQGRAETITVTNYSSGSVLDTRSIPNTNSSSLTYTNTTSTNFGNGTYLIWNVSGHVTITIATNSGPNGVVAGIFFGGSSSPTAPAITSLNNTAFTVGAPGTFTVTTTGSPIPSLSESGTLPTGVSFVDNGNGTGTLTGTPAGGSNPTYNISFKATNSASNQTQSFTLTVIPLVVSAGPSAAFVSADTNTEGNWIGTYGVDGDDVAGGPQSPANGTLSYGSYAVQGESEWTYAGTTTDQRALETDAQGDRVAATWYSGGSFSIDVNFTDNNPHQVALYVLDWDHQGRAETVTIQSHGLGAVLDTRSIPNTNSSSPTYTDTTATNFGNGTYLLWDVSGHVTITVAMNSGPNGVAAGIFFGQATRMAPAITSASSTTFPVGQSGTFTVTTTGFPTPALAENGPLPTGVSFVDNGNGTGTLSGTPAMGSDPNYSISFTATNGVSPAFTQNFILTDRAVVTFVTADTNTQGNWMGTYGADGYDIAYAAQSLPSYDQTFTVVNPDVGDLWGNSSTTDPRALEIPGGSRMPTEWNSLHFSLPPTFGFDVNFTDGQSHLLALYALDWDYQGRAEMIQVFDANSDALLDTEYVSNFANGVYLVWTISGHVTVNVTETVGSNCVISGVFFGGNAGNAINLAITPPNIGLPPGQSQQFAVTVGGTSNTGVIWAVSPAGQGSINPTIGYYTAPSSITGNQSVIVTATSAAESRKQGIATVNVTTGGVANFLATDTGTQGAYQGIYGADYGTMVGAAGNVINNGTLSYGTFNVLNGQTYVWDGSTSDPRALGGVASSWNNPSFNIKVKDGKLHQLALYALDWDMQGRAETIQIVDTATGATLDTRNISNFSNGIYVIWNISGNITINVTVTSGPNPVISGVFFGGPVESSMSVSPPSVDLSAAQSQQFSAAVNGGNGNAAWTITSVSPSGAASGSFSATTPGLYLAPTAIITPTTVIISAASSGLSGTATIILVPHATVSGPATFDTTTQGSWHGVYGTQGYSVAGNSQILPSFAAFSVSGNTNGVQYWTANTSDPRALQTGNDSGNIAAAWSKNHESFSLNVDFTDTQVHQLAIYAVDWDYQGRTESIQILDAVTGKILDTEFLSNFSNGVYLIWHISGNVTINVTNDGNTVPSDLSSGVVSGIFFQ